MLFLFFNKTRGVNGILGPFLENLFSLDNIEILFSLKIAHNVYSVTMLAARELFGNFSISNNSTTNLFLDLNN